ncbi:protein containing DUF1559 [Rhodopirellula sallentina SM41]|uniref:Protein containing DUF1559 n=2 Tax=Rhodopirellula TaxID=265488 RepID=M5UAH9_9BACT|nr:protein containing DUF1559 [Rhodopirellula sallentina SM41]
MHSWRTLILPYLGEQEIFDQFDLSQRWDADVNRAARETVVDAYRCPSDTNDGATTRYFAVIVGDGIMTGDVGTKAERVVDGMDNTIVVVEGPPEKATSWAEPLDLTADEFLAFDSETELSHHVGGTHAAMADGSIIFFTRSTDKKLLSAMLTASGGEPVDTGW